MIDEIIYTCKEYKERYNEILKQHLTEYADFDEQNFLYSETSKYKVYLSNVTYIRELTNVTYIGELTDGVIPINDVQANIWGVDIFDELQQKFKDKNNKFNIKELGKSQLSFDKILCFLGDKIAYLNSEIAIQNVKYDFEDVRKQLIKITSTDEKIEYLTGKKFDYLQNKTGIEIENGTTFDKKCELEIHKLNQINSEYPTTTPTGPEINSENTLNWQGTTLEFSEFTKALIESGFIGKIKNEKEAFERMKRFFNVKDFDKSDKLKQVRNRTKELTPVINTLETSLTNWIKRKD